MELVYSKNYFNLAKIFVLRLFKIVTNQTQCTRLEQRSIIKFLIPEKSKPCEICRRMCDFTEKHVLVKKMFTKGLIMGLPQVAWVIKIVYNCPVKKKKSFRCNGQQRRSCWQFYGTWKDLSLLISLKKVQL